MAGRPKVSPQPAPFAISQQRVDLGLVIGVPVVDAELVAPLGDDDQRDARHHADVALGVVGVAVVGGLLVEVENRRGLLRRLLRPVALAILQPPLREAGVGIPSEKLLAHFTISAWS